jgi:pyruvate,orthophosphate dikinase
MTGQLIYPFTVGDRTQSDLLGGKGANLAEMVRIGLPVPPGFTITTEACRKFLSTGQIPPELKKGIETSLNDLEKSLDREFGNPAKPLLVSVRSVPNFQCQE